MLVGDGRVSFSWDRWRCRAWFLQCCWYHRLWFGSCFTQFDAGFYHYYFCICVLLLSHSNSTCYFNEAKKTSTLYLLPQYLGLITQLLIMIKIKIMALPLRLLTPHDTLTEEGGLYRHL